MHSNPAFRRVSRDRNLRFAAERGFGVLAIDGGGPLVSHIPFILAEDGAAVHAHLVRGNPIARHLREKEYAAVLAVSGPDSYVSPDWYGTDTADQVPTWNYVAVHIRGTLRRRPDETLRAHLDALSARFESELRPKPPWTPAKVSPDQLGTLMRSIMPVELSIGERGRHLEAQSEQGRPTFVCGPRAIVESDGYGQETASNLPA